MPTKQRRGWGVYKKGRAWGERSEGGIRLESCPGNRFIGCGEEVVPTGVQKPLLAPSSLPETSEVFSCTRLRKGSIAALARPIKSVRSKDSR